MMAESISRTRQITNDVIEMLHARMPDGMWNYSIPVTKEAQSKERSKSKTERMIESGELSDHEADYWKRLEQ